MKFQFIPSFFKNFIIRQQQENNKLLKELIQVLKEGKTNKF